MLWQGWSPRDRPADPRLSRLLAAPGIGPEDLPVLEILAVDRGAGETTALDVRGALSRGRVDAPRRGIRPRRGEPPLPLLQLINLTPRRLLVYTKLSLGDNLSSPPNISGLGGPGGRPNGREGCSAVRGSDAVRDRLGTPAAVTVSAASSPSPSPRRPRSGPIPRAARAFQSRDCTTLTPP